MTSEIPESFTRFVIEDVKRHEDRLVIRYAGRIFGGVLLDVLSEDVAAAVVPGAEIIVRYHTSDTGHPNQVAHLLIRHPVNDEWVELYADWE